MQLIRDVDAENGARVPTGVLNEMLARATARMQPPSDKGRRLKIFYLTCLLYTSCTLYQSLRP